jgi:hypothetical protein
VLRDGTAVPDRSDGRFDLLVASRTIHPNSETGRAGFNVQLEGLGRRHPKMSLDSESDRTHQYSRNYLGPTPKRWTLRALSLFGGISVPAPKWTYRGAMGLSYLRIEPDVVVFRRWPRRVRRIPRTEVDRFVVLKTRGEEGVSSPRLGLREPNDYLALLMKDGHSICVPSSDPEPPRAALRLNNELLK